MTKNNTVEKIDQIINKISENVSKKGLGSDEVQDLLVDIDKDLNGLKKDSEEKYKELVEEKVKDLKDKINEKLEEEEFGWGINKTLLNKDVKGGLNELKNKIVESEEVSVSIPVIMTTNTEELEELKVNLQKEEEKRKEAEEKRNEYKGELENTKKELSETKGELAKVKKELGKFENVPQHSVEVDSKRVTELEDKIEKLNQEIGARDAFLKVLDEKIAGMPKEEKLNINKVVEQAKNNWLEGFKVAIKETDAGMGLITRPAAGLLAGGAGMVSGVIHLGVYGVEKSADNAMEIYENTRKGAQELTEKGLEVGGHVFEKYLEEGADVYKTTLKSGTEVVLNVGTGAVNVIKRGMDSGDKIGEELKEFSENMAKLGLEGFGDVMHTAADTVENWRKGWENLAGQAMSIAKSAVETKAELKFGALKIELGDKKGDINEAKVEGKDEIIKNLKEELERKNVEIESLRRQIGEQMDKGQGNLLNVIEMITKSQANSPAPSRPSTPPPYSQKQ